MFSEAFLHLLGERQYFHLYYFHYIAEVASEQFDFRDYLFRKGIYLQRLVANRLLNHIAASQIRIITTTKRLRKTSTVSRNKIC